MRVYGSVSACVERKVRGMIMRVCETEEYGGRGRKGGGQGRMDEDEDVSTDGFTNFEKVWAMPTVSRQNKERRSRRRVLPRRWRGGVRLGLRKKMEKGRDREEEEGSN